MPRLSIQTPPERTTFAELRDFWQAADGLGFYAAYTFDHLVPLLPGEGPQYRPSGPRTGGQLDGWLVATALAATTSRLLIGTLVSDVTLREPALLVKMAVTLDHVSGGRALLGVGAGWHAEEHRMFGLPFPGRRERVQRLAETVEIAIALMRTHGPVSYQGQLHRIDEAYFAPRPVQPHIPILLGGGSAVVQDLAARCGDVINCFGPAEVWPALNAELDRRLARHGRAPQDLARSAYVFADLSGIAQREQDLIARVAERSGVDRETARARVVTADRERAWRTLDDLFGAGVDEVVLGLQAPYDPAQLERFAHDLSLENAWQT